MSKTPRTDKFLKNTRSLPSAEWGEKAREFMCQLETELADKDKQLFEARAGAKKLRRAAKAYQELTTCYRTGGRPSEKLFKDLEKAKAIMADKEMNNGDSC